MCSAGRVLETSKELLVNEEMMLLMVTPTGIVDGGGSVSSGVFMRMTCVANDGRPSYGYGSSSTDEESLTKP